MTQFLDENLGRDVLVSIEGSKVTSKRATPRAAFRNSSRDAAHWGPWRTSGPGSILARSTLPAWQRQRPDPVQHVPNSLRFKCGSASSMPVIPRMLDQPTAGLHQPVCKLVSDQLLILFGSPSRRHRVAQVVGQHAQLQPYLVGIKRMHQHETSWDKRSKKYDDNVKKHDSIYHNTIDHTKSLRLSPQQVPDARNRQDHPQREMKQDHDRPEKDGALFTAGAVAFDEDFAGTDAHPTPADRPALHRTAATASR